MKKYIALALAVCLFLISPLSIFADIYTVSDLDYTVFLRVRSDSSSDSQQIIPLLRGQFVNVPETPFVGNINTAVPDIRFKSDTFIVGAKYYFSIVLYLGPDGNFSLPSSVSYAGLFSGANGSSVSLNFNQDVFTSNLFGNADYPNPWPSTMSDEEYYENSVLIEGTFIPTDTSGALVILLPFVGGWHIERASYFYDSFYAEPEEVKIMFWDSFRENLENINNFLTGSLTTLLTSIRTSIVSGFDQVHSDLLSLTNAVGQGLQMTEEDEQDFVEQDSQTDAAIQNANNKLNQTTQKNEQNKQQITNKQDKADDLENQRQEAEQQEQNFKNEFNIDGASAISGSINSNISSSGSYGSALIWWGDAFSELLRFTPIVFMLNVSVFFGLLMLLFGASSRMMVRHEVRGRRRGGD